jgi:hypothetical protein
LRGEDALPRLAKGLDAESLRDWMHRPQTELYAALPEGFIADWDSTVNTRYGHQKGAAVGYNPTQARDARAIIRRAIVRVPWPLWEGAPTIGCQQIAETTVRLQGWSRERRIVIVRTLKPAHSTPQDLF